MLYRRYKYDSISKTESSHRLVRIAKHAQGTAVRCELTTTRSGQASQSIPPYHALSYRWGSNKLDHQITVRNHDNGTTGSLRVTQNLHAFLILMCDLEYTHWLYVDAICINQGNIKEREHQVAMMGDIYGKAQKVILWLGDHPEIQYLFRGLSDRTSAGMSFLQWTQSEASEALGRDEALIHGYNAISEDLYWSRLWIVQEIRRARLVELRCGHATLVLDCLFHFWITFKDLLPPRDMNLGMLGLMRNKFNQGARQLEFYWYLSDFGCQGCSDPRDKIYGLVGLASDGADFPIDYALPVEELFFRAWSYFGFRTRADMTRLLLLALELDTGRLIQYFSSNTKRATAAVTVPACTFIQIGQSPSCLCNFEFRWAVRYRTEGYAFCCLMSGTSNPPHVLFKKSDVVGGDAAEARWTAVGLYTNKNDGNVTGILSYDTIASGAASSSAFDCSSIIAQPQLELSTKDETSRYPGVATGVSDVEITTIGLAVLVHHALQKRPFLSPIPPTQHVPDA